jgi:phosphate starvation-inducible protein PhoH
MSSEIAQSDSVVVDHRLDAEGADQLLLAGVNDANMQQLASLFGIRVVLRGDQLLLSGEMERLERAVPVIQHLIELARLRAPFDGGDVARIAEEFGRSGSARFLAEEERIRIALPQGDFSQDGRAERIPSGHT